MMRFTKRKIVFGAAALLALCCVGLFVFGSLLPDDGATEVEVTAVAVVGEGEEASATVGAVTEEANTPTPQPTKTAVPATRTPEATDTAVPTTAPSATAQPTEPPAATDTPDPGELTAEERVYRDSVLEISDSYSQALTLFSEQMLAASENVALLTNEDWVIRTATALVLLSVAGDEVRELEPSQRFEVLNDYLLEAAGHFDQVVISLPEGIDELDVEKINQASEEMLLGQLAIENATAEIKRLVEEEGVRFSNQQP